MTFEFKVSQLSYAKLGGGNFHNFHLKTLQFLKKKSCVADAPKYALHKSNVNQK